MAIEQAIRRSALVVEDDEQIAYLLRFILEREGFEVHCAPDGNGANAMLESLPPPSIVTLDVMVPHIDGYQLLAQIRAQPGWEAVPVILITARLQENDRARGLKGGASDYLVKPFRPD